MAKSADEPMQPLGWDAINRALAAIYGEGEPPYHCGPAIPYRLGGPDPLQGISIYMRDAPVPHWHYVTYGFSELYEKEWKDPRYSGFGFELTFRLALYEEEPPSWPLSLLNNLARYVFKSGYGFDVGHHLDCRGPIALGTATALRALLFARDPELGEIDTPNGKVQFLQVVGITLDELLASKKWNTNGLLQLLADRFPLLVTDLNRTSILASEDVRLQLAEGSEREGSNTAHLAIGEASFRSDGDKMIVVFGANGTIDVKEILPIRLRFGVPLLVAGPGGTIGFAPGPAAAWKETERDELRITLTADQGRRLGELLQPKVGTYSLPEVPNLVFEIRASKITDAEGKVLEVIG